MGARRERGCFNAQGLRQAEFEGEPNPLDGRRAGSG